MTKYLVMRIGVEGRGIETEVYTEVIAITDTQEQALFFLDRPNFELTVKKVEIDTLGQVVNMETIID